MRLNINMYNYSFYDWIKINSKYELDFESISVAFSWLEIVWIIYYIMHYSFIIYVMLLLILRMS